MMPEIGRSYTGPLGRAYNVVDIEGKPGEMQWVVIRREEGGGTIRFPLWDAAKWLREPD
jgi:hypothetical protein